MALIDIPKRSSKEADMKLAKKANSVRTVAPTIKGGGSIISRIQAIQAEVETNLGKYKDEYMVIRDEQTLIDYIDKCIENKYIALDTETTGLDPLLDTIAGVCIYTPDMKSAYIPINHVSYITLERLNNQLSEEFVCKQFTRLYEHEIESDMFNAAFDIRVMRKIGVKNIYCTWDAYLAMRVLNENEPRNALKKLHQKYVLDDKEDEFTFEELFKGIPFTYIPIKTAYVYASHDPIITKELADYQRKHLRPDHEREDMRALYHVFADIEMPCILAVCDLEDTGVEFDFEYNAKLKEKYHKLLDEREENFHNACRMYEKEIEAYRERMGRDCKLEDPINIQSVPQLQILLYDIAGCPLYFNKKKQKEEKSTAEDALKKLDNAIAQAVLQYREFATLVGTFIDKLPECVNPNDGRIHCKFNQYGADTGRFSSQDPNMQNIPSHNKDIRKMFKATDGYVFLSADYSQQEIKGMAQMCGDEGMIEAFRQGKDFYAEIASVAFGYPYEECLEFRPDGTTNPAGKERRAQAKSILLGINYGRGAASIAEQLGCSTKEAEQIKEDVFTGFPAIAEFEKQSYDMVNSLGYVTTLWGRKRRLPSMLLPDYDFKWADGVQVDNDLLDFDEEVSHEVPEETKRYYRNKLAKAYYKDKQAIFKQANAEGIWIIDNTKDKDYTKVVNARIQGTAADLTKLAMIKLNNDSRLKELGFRMLIQVHDEILAECPRENAKEVVKLFAEDMASAAGDKFQVPLSCDVTVTDAWYGEEVEI